jgi:diacylglycerol kinase family enzyme
VVSWIGSLCSKIAPKHLTTFHAQIDRSSQLRQDSGLVKSSANPNPGETDLLLVNPVAGGGRAGASLPNLREFAIQQCWNLEICVTQSAADLVAKALQGARRCQKRIFVLGGDGTFQLLVNSVACHPQVIVGVIPAGAGNDLAAALGLPADPVRAAALLLEGEVC